jgi:CheY-like chemotaxis protein
MTEGTRRAKLLLVDDRPDNLLALESVLASLGQEMVRATSGEEALKRLLVDDFAVILLDVQMPGMDGFETAQHIKRRERTKDVPIIFLTAERGEPHHAFRGYAAGAVDYLAKPFDPWVLRAKVSVFVDLWTKNVRLAEQASLLRAVLAAEAEGASSAADALVDELAGRVAAVAEQAELLGPRLADADRDVARGYEQLLERVRHMASVIDALRARP